MSGIDQPRLVLSVSCEFSCEFTKTGNFSSNRLLLCNAYLNSNIRRRCEHKKMRIKQLDTLYNLLQVVQNVQFAKTREKPHKKSIFKHFVGLSVPNLRQLNPARIRLRVTKKLTLRGEPVFLKKLLLGWNGVTFILHNTLLY